MPKLLHQVVWQGKTVSDILDRKCRITMNNETKLVILQDAVARPWCLEYMTPDYLCSLLRRLGFPFALGHDFTSICMEKLLNTISNLVTEKNLGHGFILRKSKSERGNAFFYTHDLRTHILASRTLHEAINGEYPHLSTVKMGQRNPTALSRAALVKYSCALVEQIGGFGTKMQVMTTMTTEMELERAKNMYRAIRRASSDHEANGILVDQFGVSLTDVREGRFSPRSRRRRGFIAQGSQGGWDDDSDPELSSEESSDSSSDSSDGSEDSSAESE